MIQEKLNYLGTQYLVTMFHLQPRCEYEQLLKAIPDLKIIVKPAHYS